MTCIHDMTWHDIIASFTFAVIVRENTEDLVRISYRLLQHRCLSFLSFMISLSHNDAHCYSILVHGYVR